MPVAKGQPYGEPGELPDDGVVVRSDAEAAAVLREARGDKRPFPVLGLLDTYDARLPPGQLLAVRARLHHGAHLPHPGIKERRAAAVQVELERPLPVRLDGVVAGPARVISVRVEPDALTVVV